MSSSSTKAQRGEVVPAPDEPVILPPAVVEAYESMIMDVPEAGGDGFASILATLAAATDVADLDAPWRSQGLGDLVNVPLRVSGIRRMPSDYPGGLPWFLVVDAAVLGTGERVTFTTGAVSVVAQLVKAHQLASFPFDVIPRQSERPSANGYFPQHLEVIRR